MMPLAIRGLTVIYPGGHRALHSLSLAVEEGACVCVVGHSGSGKSTLARAIMALLPHGSRISGVLELGGKNATALAASAWRRLCGRSVGYVPQDALAACDPLRSVGHHVAEAWNAHRLTVSRASLAGKLAGLGIADAHHRMNDRPHQWSGGMLQRAAIAAATAHNPALVVADEPTSALDFGLAQDVIQQIKLASRSQLLITHDLEMAALFADEIVIMDAGRIAERGSPEQVLERPSTAAGTDLVATIEARYGSHR